MVEVAQDCVRESREANGEANGNRSAVGCRWRGCDCFGVEDKTGSPGSISTWLSIGTSLDNAYIA